MPQKRSLTTVLPSLDQPNLFKNHIVRSVSNKTFRMLADEAEIVVLAERDVLCKVGENPEIVYFLEGGIMSFTLQLPKTGTMEFGVIGREGVSSLSALWPDRAQPVQTTLHVGGHPALRVSSDRYRYVFRRREDLRNAVYRFLYEFMGQVAFTAASNAHHLMIARLARWLLLLDERFDDGEMPVTHEFIARALGTQRTTVTATLHKLEGEGSIKNLRGVVIIVDRKRLEAIAGEAYLPRSDSVQRVAQSRRATPLRTGSSSG